MYCVGIGDITTFLDADEYISTTSLNNAKIMDPESHVRFSPFLVPHNMLTLHDFKQAEASQFHHAPNVDKADITSNHIVQDRSFDSSQHQDSGSPEQVSKSNINPYNQASLLN